jgi:hypothetical protein
MNEEMVHHLFLFLFPTLPHLATTFSPSASSLPQMILSVRWMWHATEAENTSGSDG